MSGKALSPVQQAFDTNDDDEDRANRRRLWRLILFVAVFATASLVVYVWLRPPNRHLEATPYEEIISQLRSSMTEADVLTIFRAAKDGVPRTEISAYEENTANGPHRVVTYTVGGEAPLQVRLGGSGNTVTEWCYRDHCHDNIQ